MSPEILHLPFSTIANNSEPGSDTSEDAQLLLQAPGGLKFGVCCRFGDRKDDAADLVQATIFETFPSWIPFRGVSRVTTWLNRILASKA